MREKKFRGQLDDDLDFYEIDLHLKKGEWVFGNLITNDGVPYIVGDIMDCGSDYIILEFWYPVIPETVGQYIGREDKNDKEIYEMDIVRNTFRTKEQILECYWNNSDLSFCFRDINLKNGVDYIITNAEIIGNIHDNPELLEAKE